MDWSDLSSRIKIGIQQVWLDEENRISSGAFMPREAAEPWLALHEIRYIPSITLEALQRMPYFMGDQKKEIILSLSSPEGEEVVYMSPAVFRQFQGIRSVREENHKGTAPRSAGTSSDAGPDGILTAQFLGVMFAKAGLGPYVPDSGAAASPQPARSSRAEPA